MGLTLPLLVDESALEEGADTGGALEDVARADGVPTLGCPEVPAIIVTESRLTP